MIFRGGVGLLLCACGGQRSALWSSYSLSNRLLGSKSSCEACVPDTFYSACSKATCLFFPFLLGKLLGFNMYFYVYLCKRMPYMCRQLWMAEGRACQTNLSSRYAAGSCLCGCRALILCKNTVVLTAVLLLQPRPIYF